MVYGKELAIMLLKRTDIEKKLEKAKFLDKTPEAILSEVHNILLKQQENRERIEENIAKKQFVSGNEFVFDLLETGRIYHIAHIKKICINYRLRFLDSKFFKGKIPPEALSEIGRLEKEHHIEIKGFKLLAPSRLFKLEDKDDPLLFAPIGNDYFYLIHKWGNDLHPLRRLLVWPFKDIRNLIVLVLAMSYGATLLIPNGLFSKSSTPAEFWIIYFFVFKGIASVVLFYGFALGKNFNPAIWKSKYYNA